MSIVEELRTLHRDESIMGHKLKELHRQEHFCDNCGQRVAITRHAVDDADVSALLKMWHYVIEQKKNDVDVRESTLSYTERSRVTQLRFHALIAKVWTDKNKHVPSHWLITKRGGDFLRGEARIPKHVYTYNNEVVGHGEEMVHRSDFRVLDDFGPHFSYVIIDGDVLRNINSQGKLL